MMGKRYARRDELLGRLAEDLVRQLGGAPEDPALAAEVLKIRRPKRCPSFRPISRAAFEKLLFAAATGKLTVAMRESDVSPTVLAVYLRHPGLRKRWDAARRRWKQWRRESVLTTEEVLEEIARSSKTLQAACLTFGLDRAAYQRLARLLARVPELSERYLRIRRMGIERLRHELLAEADEASSPKELREIRKRMHGAERHLPDAIRPKFKRTRSPVEKARLRAGLRQSGKRRTAEETTPWPRTAAK